MKMEGNIVAPKRDDDVSQKDRWFEVYSYDTGGSVAEKTFAILVDLKNKTQKPVWQVLADVTKWERNDSRKNAHRKGLIKVSKLLEAMDNDTLLKVVNDYSSARRRKINVTYYIKTDDGLSIIDHENDKINGKYYDVIELDGKKTNKTEERKQRIIRK